MKKQTLHIPIEASNLLKLIACIVIMLHHYSQYGLDAHRISGTVFEVLRSVGGTISVSLFFFLSGYGLMVAESKRQFELKRFMTKRFWRVLKPFWLVNLFAVVIYWILNADNIATHSPLHAAGSILGIIPFDPTMWFVRYLLVIYILFAFGMLLKRPVSFVATTILIYIAAAIITHQPTHSWCSLFAFPLGMYVGRNPESSIKFFRRLDVALLCTVIYSLLLYFIILPDTKTYGPLWHQMNNILLIVLLIFAIGRIPAKYFKWYNPTSKLQPYYEVYLVHPKILFISIFCLDFFPPLWIFIPLTIGIALAFCNIPNTTVFSRLSPDKR